MVTVRSHSRNLSPDPSVGSFEHRGARLATPTLFALYFLAVGVFVPGCENSSAPTGEPGRSGAALVDSVGGLFLCQSTGTLSTTRAGTVRAARSSFNEEW
jgi:hypothetical protein